MRILIGLLLLIIIVPAAAQTTQMATKHYRLAKDAPPAVVEWFSFQATIKAPRIGYWKMHLAGAKEMLRRARAGEYGKDKTAKEKRKRVLSEEGKKAILEAQAEVDHSEAALVRLNDPMQLEYMHFFFNSELKVGLIGWSSKARVVKVLDNQSAICKLGSDDGGWTKEVWLTGVDFSESTVDAVTTLTIPVIVTESARPPGYGDTLFHFVPFDPQPYLQIVEE